MEAVVTISLKELEDLKNLLKEKQRKVEELEENKDITITIDVSIYSMKTGRTVRDNHVSVYGQIQHLFDDKVKLWRDVQNKIRQVSDEYLKESKEVKFYNICPKWIRELVIQFCKRESDKSMKDSTI